MPNPLFLRYGALAGGLLYGVTHNWSLYRQHKKAQDEHDHHQKVLDKANELWSQHVTKQLGVNFDPDSPAFDLEKVLQYADSQSSAAPAGH
ncbi:hypothetical protein MP638_005674 [Amoeboaphelidium occidentale]|nr:hypothetical protein MP638_005674 [Amoeboaphelidium occidentale]